MSSMPAAGKACQFYDESRNCCALTEHAVDCILEPLDPDRARQVDDNVRALTTVLGEYVRAYDARVLQVPGLLARLPHG